MVVFAALAGMHGEKVVPVDAPVVDDVNWKIMLPVTVPAMVIGPTAAEPPMADTLKPQMYVVWLADAASVPTTAPVVPVPRPNSIVTPLQFVQVAGVLTG